MTDEETAEEYAKVYVALPYIIRNTNVFRG